MLNLKTVIPVCALFLASCGNEPEEPWAQEGFDDFTICVDNEIALQLGEQPDYDFFKKNFRFIDRLAHSLTSTGPIEDVANAFSNCIKENGLDKKHPQISDTQQDRTFKTLYNRGAPENARK